MVWTNNRLLDLIHRKVDGELSPGEQVELDRLVVTNRSAQELQAGLERVHNALIKIPTVEPPAGMKTEIMRRIEPWPTSDPSRFHQARELFEAIRERFRVRPAIPFAVGVAAGLMVFAIYLGTADRVSLTGDHQVAATLVAPVPDQQPLFSREFRLPEATGTIAVTRSAGIIWVQLETAADGETGIELSYDPGDLTFHGLSNENALEATMSQADGSIKLLQSGSSTLRLAFVSAGDQATTIKVVITAGAEQYQDSIVLGSESGAASEDGASSE